MITVNGLCRFGIALQRAHWGYRVLYYGVWIAEITKPYRDCWSLLFKGEDFPETDVATALE